MKKLQKEKNDLLAQLHQIETEILELQKENKEESYLEILNLAKRVLNLKDPSKEIYSKLIKKIEFNSNKEVTVTLTFGEVKIEEYKKAI